VGCHCGMSELVSAVLDGEATDLERAAVRRHLRSCAPCREFSEFSQSTGVRAREGLVSPVRATLAVDTRRMLSGARLAKEVRRGRGGRAARQTAVTLMVTLLFGVVVGVGGAQMLGGRGFLEVVQPPHGTRPAPSRPLSPNFVRLFETPPQKHVASPEPERAGSAQWQDRFVEYVSSEESRPSPKPARLALAP
jgi:hypothetical protein